MDTITAEKERLTRLRSLVARDVEKLSQLSSWNDAQTATLAEEREKIAREKAALKREYQTQVKALEKMFDDLEKREHWLQSKGSQLASRISFGSDDSIANSLSAEGTISPRGSPRLRRPRPVHIPSDTTSSPSFQRASVMFSGRSPHTVGASHGFAVNGVHTRTRAASHDQAATNGVSGVAFRTRAKRSSSHGNPPPPTPPPEHPPQDRKIIVVSPSPTSSPQSSPASSPVSSGNGSSISLRPPPIHVELQPFSGNMSVSNRRVVINRSSSAPRQRKKGSKKFKRRGSKSRRRGSISGPVQGRSASTGNFRRSSTASSSSARRPSSTVSEAKQRLLLHTVSRAPVSDTMLSTGSSEPSPNLSSFSPRLHHLPSPQAINTAPLSSWSDYPKRQRRRRGSVGSWHEADTQQYYDSLQSDTGAHPNLDSRTDNPRDTELSNQNEEASGEQKFPAPDLPSETTKFVPTLDLWSKVSGRGFLPYPALRVYHGLSNADPAYSSLKGKKNTGNVHRRKSSVFKWLKTKVFRRKEKTLEDELWFTPYDMGWASTNIWGRISGNVPYECVTPSPELSKAFTVPKPEIEIERVSGTPSDGNGILSQYVGANNSPHAPDQDILKLVNEVAGIGTSESSHSIRRAASSRILKATTSWVAKRNFSTSGTNGIVVNPSTEDEVVAATAHAYSRANPQDDGFSVSVVHSGTGAALAAMSTLHSTARDEQAETVLRLDDDDEEEGEEEQEEEGAAVSNYGSEDQDSGSQSNKSQPNMQSNPPPLSFPYGQSRGAVSSIGSQGSSPKLTADYTGNDWLAASERWRMQRSPYLPPSQQSGLPLFRARCDSVEGTRSPRSLSSFRDRRRSMFSDDGFDRNSPDESKQLEDLEEEFRGLYGSSNMLPPHLKKDTGSFRVLDKLNPFSHWRAIREMIDANDFSALSTPAGTPILRLDLLCHPTRYLVRDGKVFYTKLLSSKSIDAVPSDQWSLVRCILLTDILFIGRQQEADDLVQIVGCLPLVNMDCRVLPNPSSDRWDSQKAVVLQPLDGPKQNTIAFTFALEQEASVWVSDIKECIRRTEAAILDSTSGSSAVNSWFERPSARHGAPVGIGLKDLIRVDN